MFRWLKFQPKCCGSRQVLGSILLWPYKMPSETQMENRLYVPIIQSLHNMTTLWCTKQVLYIIAVQRTPLTKNYWGKRIVEHKDSTQSFCILSPYINKTTHIQLHLTLLPWMPFGPGSPGGPLIPYTNVKVQNELPLKTHVKFLLNLAWTGHSKT